MAYQQIVDGQNGLYIIPQVPAHNADISVPAENGTSSDYFYLEVKFKEVKNGALGMERTYAFPVPAQIGNPAASSIAFEIQRQYTFQLTFGDSEKTINMGPITVDDYDDANVPALTPLDLSRYIPNSMIAMLGGTAKNTPSDFNVLSVNWSYYATNSMDTATVTLEAVKWPDFKNYYFIHSDAPEGIKVKSYNDKTVELEIVFRKFTLSETLNHILTWPSTGFNKPAVADYTIFLNGGEEILAPTILNSSEEISITLAEHTESEEVFPGAQYIKLDPNETGSLFTINNNVTLNVQSGLHLVGHDHNSTALIRINNGGTLDVRYGMGGESSIEGNTNTGDGMGGGVYVGQGGKFSSTHSTISGHSVIVAGGDACGGGVYVDGGEFYMGQYSALTGCKAETGNGESYGGGVYVKDGTFTVQICWASINGNIAEAGAGMSYGGGVYVKDATFSILKGDPHHGQAYIRDNKAGENNGKGGGIYVDTGCTFYRSGDSEIDFNNNVAANGEGHTIFVANDDGNCAIQKNNDWNSVLDAYAVWDSDNSVWDFKGTDANWAD
jgi:hypothetical protein